MITILIPARGGSKGVRHKNLRSLAGKPLVVHAIETAKRFGLGTVVVSTDDSAIASIARLHGVQVDERPDYLAEDHVTIDRLVDHYRREWPHVDLMVLQPTLPEITVEDLVAMFDARVAFPMMAVVPEKHLIWDNDSYAARPKVLGPRVNRQDMTQPAALREIGLRYYPRDCDGLEPVPYLLRDRQVTDIDTLAELRDVHRTMTRGLIVFRPVGVRITGSGHVRRCLTIADELQDHEIKFAVDLCEDWAKDMIEDAGYDTGPIVPEWYRFRERTPNLTPIFVSDILDSDIADIAGPKSAGFGVIAFEDNGQGALHADLVINALYPDTNTDCSGPDWFILRPEFRGLPEKEIRAEGDRVLVTFGGTDPSHLTEKLIGISDEWPNVDFRFIHPPASDMAILGVDFLVDPVMVEQMMWADVVVTSAGRTVYEAAATGTPALVLAQNWKELGHRHLGAEYGNLHLGHGRLNKEKRIVDHLMGMLSDQQLRIDMSARGRELVDGKGLRRITRRIEDLIEGL